MEVGMSVDEYAQMIFTMVCCFAAIGLVMALVADDDYDRSSYPRRTEGFFRDRYTRRRRKVDLEEETVED